MDTFRSFEQDLYSVNDESFSEIALKLFHFQVENNLLYSRYIQHLNIDPGSIRTIDRIPYLPVSFFKNHDIKAGNWNPEVIYTSSGTSGMVSSRHLVRFASFYLEHAAKCFSFFYGKLQDYLLLALLPSYVEQGGSSLIAMIEDFIRRTGSPGSGFYHTDPERMIQAAQSSRDKKVLIWGVTYALLDIAEKGEVDLSNAIIMETGGMKGRRKEITRNELHEFLGQRFNTSQIHSEYGMTELMSQAYSAGDGIFRCPPWMKILVRDPEDPRGVTLGPARGGINIIDLANFHSCAFIETQDLGRVGQNGSFEVLGRLDNSDIRGCNLLVE